MIHKEEVKSHFDELANIYDDLKERNSYYYKSLKKVISELSDRYSFNSVLDIGCGTGELLISLHPKKGLSIDISPAMIHAAKKKGIIVQDSKNKNKE